MFESYPWKNFELHLKPFTIYLLVNSSMYLLIKIDYNVLINYILAYYICLSDKLIEAVTKNDIYVSKYHYTIFLATPKLTVQIIKVLQAD